jgi:hypothetical protein
MSIQFGLKTGCDIVSGAVATRVRQIKLPITFETWENYRFEYMKFEVANFEMTYNTFLGRPALTNFMVIPHYAYLVLKMTTPMESSRLREMSIKLTTTIGKVVRW